MDGRAPAAGRVGGRHCTAGQSCYVPLGRHLVLLALVQERRGAERINRHLKQQLATSGDKAPNVMEYIDEKANLYDLQKKVKTWERKVDIANVSCSMYHYYYWPACT